MDCLGLGSVEEAEISSGDIVIVLFLAFLACALIGETVLHAE